MCRKAQGAAFRSRARVRAADFHWVAGEELLTFYESSPGNHRGFCRICGSPILTRFDIDNSIPIPRPDRLAQALLTRGIASAE